MIDERDNKFQFRVNSKDKKEFTNKARERYMTASDLLNMFVAKFNKDTSNTLLFLIKE